DAALQARRGAACCARGLVRARPAGDAALLPERRRRAGADPRPLLAGGDGVVLRPIRRAPARAGRSRRLRHARARRGYDRVGAAAGGLRSALERTEAGRTGALRSTSQWTACSSELSEGPPRGGPSLSMDPEGRSRTGISAVDSCVLYRLELPRGRAEDGADFDSPAQDG